MTNLKSTITIVFLLLGLNLFAQENGEIKGKVIDKITKQAIPFASIKIINTTKGSLADSLGLFSFSNIEEGIYSININSVGYQEQRINDIRVIRNKVNYLEIELEMESKSLSSVTVKGYKFENSPLMPVSTYSFSREEISRNPGAQGDIFRAIGMLPGVSSSGGAFSAIAVRGQGTRDNVYMVDDIPVFSLAHLEGSPNGFNDPNGGRFSIFAPRVISSAVYQGGGFSSTFGRRSASYLGLTIKEGNKESYTVDGQLDLMGGTINYDGPSFLFKNTSLFISARTQNIGNVVEIANLQDLGIPKYQDFIFKSTTRINEKNKLSIVAIYSPETFIRDTSNVRADKNLNRLFILNRKSNQTILGLNLLSLTSKSSNWKNVLYYNATHTINSYGNAFPSTDNSGVLIPNSKIAFEDGIKKIDYEEYTIGYRSIFTKFFEDKSRLTIGAEFDKSALTNNRKLSRTDTSYIFSSTDYRPNASTYYSLILPQFFNADYNNSAYNASAYVDYSFQLLKKLTVNAGLRYDYTGFTNQSSISPRLSGSYQFDEKQSLNFSTGIYYQDPLYAEIADQPQNKTLKNQKIMQSIIGYKYHFSNSLKLTVEGWYKTFDNVLVRSVNGSSEQNSNGTGYSSGLDINLTKRLSEYFHGQIGYSYMVSKRNDNNGLGDYNFTFSQPNQFNFLISYKGGKHWLFATKFRYATGKPTYDYIVHTNVLNNPNKIRYSQEITAQGTKRLPDFMSLDVRADYNFKIKSIALNAFIDIADINNRTNAYQELFNPLTGKTFYDGISIFPSFGLKFQF